MCPVAAGEIGRFAHLFGTIRLLEARHYSVPRILKTDQFDPALDLDPARAKVLDQQALVLILREHQFVRKRPHPLSHLTERGTPRLSAAYPLICGGELHPPLYHFICDTDLAIELESARRDD